MDAYIVVLTVFGFVVLLTAWLPVLLEELPLSLPIFCVLFGAVIFALPVPGGIPHPQEQLGLTERLAEAVVIVALMGAGLKLDRPLAWPTSGVTWRLLGIAMPLTILAITLLGQALLGLGLATALLLAAALAPTDPVLASDVQVGPPQGEEEDEVRYALTSEAGLNDGLAFPFVNLAIALVVHAGTADPWLRDWFLVDVVWKLAAGVAVGVAVGRLLGWLAFRIPDRARLARTSDGFVALGITAVAYGLTEAVHGYGFIAVFVAALSFRAVERHHDYHVKLHEFIEQLERLLMMALLVLLGGAVTGAGLLDVIGGTELLFAGLVIFLVRPVAGWLSLLGRPEEPAERAVVAFFGIRGLGSVYYLAYGLERGDFAEPELLWAVTGTIMLLSILIHGATVTPIMRRLDQRRE